MSGLKIDINTKAFESKLKIAHKHIGNMLDELDAICDECGSTNTEIVEVYGDDEVQCSVKHCNDCDEKFYDGMGK